MPAYDTNKDAHGRTDVLHDPKWLQASINARTNNGRRAPDQQAQEWMAALDELQRDAPQIKVVPSAGPPTGKALVDRVNAGLDKADTSVDSALNTWDWRSAINNPTAAKQGGASKYDQQMAQLDDLLGAVVHGGQPQQAQQPAGGDRPAYTIAPEHVADYIASGGQGSWDLSNPGAPAYRGGNLPYTMVNGQPVQWGAVPTGGDPSVGALDNAQRSVNSSGQQVVKLASGGTIYSGAGPSHGLDDAKQFINDRGQNTYQFPDGGTATSEKPRITNPIKAGVDWPELPKSPIAQNDRNDLNNMLNQQPETQFLAPSPPPQPTPTPSPEPVKKEDESYV